MEKREQSKPQRTRLVADQAKPVPLHVAASVVHQQLSSSWRTSMRKTGFAASLKNARDALGDAGEAKAGVRKA